MEMVGGAGLDTPLKKHSGLLDHRRYVSLLITSGLKKRKTRGFRVGR